MIDNSISLDTTAATPTISLDTGNAENYMLSPDAISQRAFKFAYSSQDTSSPVSQDDATTALQTGQESNLRQTIASAVNSDAASNRNDLLSQTIAAKQGPLTPEDMASVDQASGYNFPFKYPLDPNSILEVNYAKQYSSELNNFAQKLPDTNFWNYGQLVARNDIEAAQIFGDVSTAQHQYLMTKSEDAEAKVQNQSTIGYGADLAKIMFPVLNPYYELKLRGNVPGVGYADGGLLGQNLEAQRLKLQSMPFDQFTSVVDNVYNKLSADNPQAALAWVSAMTGQSSTDKLLNNVNTIGHMLDVPVVFSIGKTIFSKAALLSDVRTAVTTALKAQTPDATKADILASVGNIPDSSVAGATKILADRVAGTSTPTADALSTLPANMNLLKTDISNASNLSQTQKNILLEQTDGSISNVLQTMYDTIRPTRVNLEEITGNTLYQVQKTIIDRYPGENIVRIDNPVLDPISKTYSSRVWWGKSAGDGYIDYHEAGDAGIAKGFRVTYDEPHLADLDARIDSLKQDIKAGPDMHADTGELNYFNSLPDTLQSLVDKREAVSKPGGATIQQQGLSYFVEKYVPYKETDKKLLDLVASPDNPLSVSPDSWTKHIPYLNYLRTAEDTFSPEARANRKAAVYPQARYLAAVSKDGQIISDFFRGVAKFDPVTGEINPYFKRGMPVVSRLLNKGYANDFIKFLDHSQSGATDPVTKIKGYYFTPEEMNHFYLTTFERSPTFPEVQAYEAIKRWDETQRIFTQTSVYRDQARRGNETHALVFKDANGNTAKSPEFTAALRSTLPRGRGTMLVMGEDIGDSRVKSLDRMSKKDKDTYAEQISKGYKLLQVDRPDYFPFKTLGVKNGDSLIHYVLTPNVETSSLKWDSVPRTGGGRHVYDYSLYIKQPSMKFQSVDGNRTANYLGDKTVAAVAYRHLGEDVTKKLNVVRDLIDRGKDTEAKAAYVHNGLEGAFEPWREFRAKFNRFKDDDGVWHDPAFNTKEDFRVVPRNSSIVDLDKTLETKYGPLGSGTWKNTWRDNTRENNPGKNFQIQFTGERDAQEFNEITNKGTTTNPVYDNTPAKMIDPISMLNRGMRSTINSLFMDDYKIYGVNSWLREAVEHLKAPDSEVWSAPFATFKTITKDSFKPGFVRDNPGEVNRLLANHFKIDQLVGTPTLNDTFVHAIAQNIADAAYRTLGPTAANRIVPQWLLPKLRDPFAFIRSVTFDAYLGLFSLPQILVQSMTYVNMFAISPKYATQGTLGAYLHYLSRFNKNPEILEALDKIATKFGYKPGEWIESMKTFDNTGFSKVGAEHGLMDNMHRSNIIKSGKDTFLEWGRKPFQWGEQNSRIGAWYTAMKEYRDLNPTGKLSETAKAQILDKADFYYGNMSVASHSALNSGILSLPTQFYMYSARLAEMFWSGSRLGGTLAERNLARARLVAINGAMFGVPMAAGVTGAPVTDYLRKELLDNGYFGLTPPYAVGQNFVESFINEGALSGLLAAATGKWYNVGPREGLQGMSNLKDVVSQDGAFWKIAGGASASLSMNTFNNGIYPLVYQAYRDGFRSLKLENFIDVVKEAQVVNSGWSAIMALNTGKWINKNSDFISDTSKASAMFMFASGLRETKQSDIFNKEDIIKNRDDSQKYALKQFTLNMNRSMLADKAGDPQQAQDFRTTAISWLPATDFPIDKLGSAIARASQGAQSLPARMDFEMYYKKAPPAQQEKLRKVYEYIKQNEGK